MDLHCGSCLRSRGHLRDLLLRARYDWYVLTRYIQHTDIYACLGVDLADEDRKFMAYLADNGWVGEVGEDDDTVFEDDISISTKR